MYRRKIHPIIDGKKICTGCHQNLSVDNFGFIFKKNGKHIQKSKCKECLKHATEYWRDNHREKYKASRIRYRETNKDRLRVTAYRQGATYRNIECSLTDEQFIAMFNQPCTYCGSQEVLNGVDRLDNTQGYTTQNSVSCCTICNLRKKKMTKQEFLDWIKRVALHQGFIQAS